MLGAGATLLFATMVITFDLDAASAAIARTEFEDGWNRWNLLRTATAVLGAVRVATSRTGSPTRAR
jgi:hypothetical protein